ncbi:MAG: ABC transporter ATP-binding protein [Firmicutes bacterium]|nr:ABC transporter ATP-binding protein [Bacillota bacterium]
MSLALRLEGVTKRYGAHVVLDDVTLDVEPGTLHAIIGPNGAGKSTLFGVVSGEHTVARGRVLLGGRDVTRVPAATRVGMGVARAFQVARVFPDLTVADNVLVAVLASHRLTQVFWRRRVPERTEREARRALERMQLTALADRPARSLSQGDRKRLEIGMALALDARLLLLDEPTAGMSPEETAATTRLIREVWRETGVTVLLTEHDMQVVFDLAQRLTVLHRGRVLCTDVPERVRERPDVAEVYLGVSAQHA